VGAASSRDYGYRATLFRGWKPLPREIDIKLMQIIQIINGIKIPNPNTQIPNKIQIRKTWDFHDFHKRVAFIYSRQLLV